MSDKNSGNNKFKSNSEVATHKVIENNDITVKFPPKVATPDQLQLDLGIAIHTEIQGVGMGVLSDGTAFLTERGLASLCGVSRPTISTIASEWTDNEGKERISKIKEIVSNHGTEPTKAYIRIMYNGGWVYAYPDVVCLSILEYYAFDASPIKEEAKKNYRLLAGKALRDFIYSQVGYDPDNLVSDQWRQFHDRVSLTYNSVPSGYFGVFKEMSDMIVHLGQSGLHIDSKFVPDVSVGMHWAKYWTANNLDVKYGDRKKYDHNYPDYFPQSESNPQGASCYPEEALGEFRKWFREVYIGDGKFKNYITSKVKEKQLPVSFAQIALSAYEE